MESRGTGVSAIVEFDYAANESDELSLVKGEVITNIKTQAGGWWHGTVASTGKSGMFPDNFVKLLEHNNDDKVILRDKTSVKNRKCKVIYSYKENKDDELTLAVGDLIEVFEEIEEGWWRGKSGNKVGVFPSNFVELIDSTSPSMVVRKSLNNTILQNKINNNRSSLTSSREDLVSHNTNVEPVEVPILPPKPIREQCKVLYAYSPVNEDELKLAEGDIVNIVTKELPDKGWWKGELRGKIGVFPDNFVTLLPSSSSEAVKPPIGTKIINTSSASLKSSNTTITSAYRKNSFGSKDSLNESTNNERNSGIFGNVAAHRRSLETKSMEVSIEKPPRKSLVITDANKTPAEIRKSLENLDDGKKSSTSTPPPVLTKKPTVPIKKSPSVSTVAGSIFSGLKQKVKSVESKLHAAHEVTDGTGSSKMTVADISEKSVTVEKINELDTVERGSGYLQDVRQNRAKAPKRRPPTHASGDTNNNNVNMNGSHVESNDSITHEITSSPAHQAEEEQVKPKAREWEKHRAPWMEELKANQARKTSPNIEQKGSPDDEKHDMSKSFSSSFSHVQQQQQQKEIRASSLEMKSNSFREESTATKSTTKISITENSSSVMTSSTAAATSSSTVKVEESNLRPTSVSLRNRSISPIPRVNHVVKPSPTSNVTATHITASSTLSSSTDQRVIELEQRVNKLETLITTQNTTIEDLKRMLKDESDKVKSLKSDLEKYAQCFTQDKRPTSRIFVNNFNKH